MKPHPQSNYSNENPPYLDPEWNYKNSDETDVRVTFVCYMVLMKIEN